MRQAVVATGTALLLAGCGSGTAPSAPAPPLAAVDPASPQVVTAHAVEALLGAVPVPPGAHPASPPEARRITAASYSSSENRVDRHATYVVPMSMDAVIAWYRDHHPTGTVSSGSTRATDHGVVTMTGLMFGARGRSPAYDELEADVAAQPGEHDDALVRIDAQAVWIPAVTAAERVPAGATSVRIVQRTSPRRTVHRATFTGQPLRRLIHMVNGLSPFPPGTYNCPNDTGASDVLTFHGPWPERRYHVSASGCGFVNVRSGGRSLGPGLGGGSRVDRLVTRLLSSRR